METSYLVVVDDTPESRVALRWAARRAAHVEARLTLLHVLAETEFMAFGGVQATLEAEAEAHASALLDEIAADCGALTGRRPSVIVKRGETRAAVLATVAADASIRALVLGAAGKGAPGPLVSFFTERAGALPCLVMIVPGGLDDARIDALT